MLTVGLIGLGPEWEQRFRPALAKLRHRIRVQGVYAAVANVADQIAAEWKCEPATGMLALMQRKDVRAVLILDAAWYGAVPAELACRAGKPAFLAGSLADWGTRSDRMLVGANDGAPTLMPDFAHRYTPATSRLKELLATRLGRPLAIALSLPENKQPDAVSSATAPVTSPLWQRSDALLAAIDWVCHLIGTAPVSVERLRSADGFDEARLVFQRPAAGGDSPTASICIGGKSRPTTDWRAEVGCLKGRASVQGPDRIDWEDPDGGRSESLGEERSAVEVMLDHFSRRVVGGLIPAPTLDDLQRAVRLAGAADRSLALGVLESVS
ncbi:MAG: hypothetical protein ACKV0T_25955 [Planctomycetales bacterium]